MGKVDEIMKAVREYSYDTDEYLEMLENLKVEGFEDELFRVYEGIRCLLDSRLEKKIREILESYEVKCDEENKVVYRVNGIMIDK